MFKRRDKYKFNKGTLAVASGCGQKDIDPHFQNSKKQNEKLAKLRRFLSFASPGGADKLFGTPI